MQMCVHLLMALKYMYMYNIYLLLFREGVAGAKDGVGLDPKPAETTMATRMGTMRMEKTRDLARTSLVHWP